MIDLWWIGTGELVLPVVEQARLHLEGQFERRVGFARRAGRPEEAFDRRRRQWSSSRLVRWLAESIRPDAERVLGVTDEDLFIPVLTYVFGEAQLNGRAAIVSTARLFTGGSLAVLRSVLRSPDAERQLLGLRLAKECTHELGHTYGLIHCSDDRCAMARSASLAEVDAKGAGLSPRCRGRLRHATTHRENDR